MTNCLKKPKEKKQTPPTKGRKAKAEDSDSDTESDDSSIHGASATVKWYKDEFLKLAKVAPEEDKVELIKWAADGEEGF